MVHLMVHLMVNKTVLYFVHIQLRFLHIEWELQNKSCREEHKQCSHLELDDSKHLYISHNNHMRQLFDELLVLCLDSEQGYSKSARRKRCHSCRQCS